MPHLLVEHSANINPEVNFAQLLLAVNKALIANFPQCFPAPQALKSRSVCTESYAIGDDAEQQTALGFIHFSFKLMECEEAIRIGLSQCIANTAKSYLDDTLDFSGKQIQLTVFVDFIHKPSFAKIVFE